MVELQIRFGRLLAAHRRRLQLTQQSLADAADLSVDMVTRIEAGGTGVSFSSIERLALALRIDPAELFTSQFARSNRSPELESITSQLSALSTEELRWVSRVLTAVIERNPRQSEMSTQTGNAEPPVVGPETSSQKHRRGVPSE